ncbi:MAG: NUDIX domain-containing protein [Candidatus Levyibacteriota bacterium]|jgi:ADP-ribose pyrophosphatase YjhB (NUDIX family)
MHKDFYASGFLYHPKSQQILLQQPITADSETGWSLFEGKSLHKETAAETFRRIIRSQLHLELKPKHIFPIYSYFHADKGKDNFIHYAIVRKLETFPKSKKTEYTWFTFKQIQKMHIPDQIKQDIIVGQRVIDSAMRKSLGQQTIE